MSTVELGSSEYEFTILCFRTIRRNSQPLKAFLAARTIYRESHRHHSSRVDAATHRLQMAASIKSAVGGCYDFSLAVTMIQMNESISISLCLVMPLSCRIPPSLLFSIHSSNFLEWQRSITTECQWCHTSVGFRKGIHFVVSLLGEGIPLHQQNTSTTPVVELIFSI